MDFITALPPSQGYSVIMVIIDKFSKFGHFIPLKADFTSKIVAEVFLQQIIKLHGFPRSIISDRDKVFISKFWQQLFQAQGTKLKMSSAYHPQSDGQSEVLNKTLEMYLRCTCHENPRSWLSILPWAQYWYNTSYHSAIKTTPYKALYGRDPPSLVRYEVSIQDEKSVQEMLSSRDSWLQQLKQNMSRSQEFMKLYADKNRRPLEFEEGELVLVKLQPYRQHSLALRKNQKLGLRYFGPFRITKKIGTVAYRLELPETARIHNVFHISLLKKFKGDHTTPYLPLPLQTLESGPILPPHMVLDSRTILQNDKEVQQLLIQWGDDQHAETSWESLTEFKQSYPNFNLEDKVKLKGEGIVRKKKLAAEVEGDTCTRRSNRAKTTDTWLKDFVA